MVLHHLTVEEAVRLIREMARVARLGVVVNDLERSRLGWIGAWLMAPPADRQSLHAPRCAAVRPPVVPGGRDGRAAARCRTIPVKTVRGAMGQRYAIAALSTQGPGDWLDDPDASPDPIGAGG